jgi:hypothetical protein
VIADEASRRSTVLTGAAAGALALLLSALLCAAFLALHGWGTRSEQWTVQQGILSIVADYGGLGAAALPAVFLILAIGAVLAGGLVGSRGPRIVGRPPVRVAKLLALITAAYFTLAFVVASLPVVLARGAGAFWAFPLLGLYGLVGAALLFPLTAVPLVAAAALVERRTRPRDGQAPLPSWMPRAAVVPLVLVVAALGTYTAMRYAMREWDVQGSDGNRCVVIASMPRSAVRLACGRPTDTGAQPKRVDLTFRPPFINACSAEVDVFGNSRVDFDCSGRVARVGQINVEGYIPAPDSFQRP